MPVDRRGIAVADTVSQTLENLEALAHLHPHLDRLALSRADFDRRHLRDAEVVTPTWDDIGAHSRSLVDLVRESTAIRGIGTGLPREVVRALTESTVDGDSALEIVYESAVIERSPTIGKCHTSSPSWPPPRTAPSTGTTETLH